MPERTVTKKQLIKMQLTSFLLFFVIAWIIPSDIGTQGWTKSILDAFSIIPLVARLSHHPEIGGTAGAFYIILLFIPMLFFAVMYAFFVKKEAVLPVDEELRLKGSRAPGFILVFFMLFLIVMTFVFVATLLCDHGPTYSRFKGFVYLSFMRATFFNAMFSFFWIYMVACSIIHSHNKIIGVYDVK